MIFLADMFFQEMSPRDNPCQVLAFWLHALAFVCVFLPMSGSQPPFFWLPSKCERYALLIILACQVCLSSALCFFDCLQLPASGDSVCLTVSNQ